MTYMYDIVLNWCVNDLYEFYEWNNGDKFEHIKKIPIIRVNKKTFNDLLNNKFELDDKLLNKIYNLTEIYSLKKVNKINYAFLITDTERVLGIKIDKNCLLLKSFMIIDEEREALMISLKLKEEIINYKILSKEKNDIFLTRKEKEIKKFLINELNICNKDNRKDELIYLYSEYFNDISFDKDYIYNSLLKTLDLEINNNHKRIYDILKLSVNKS